MSRRRTKGNGDGTVFERRDRPGWVYAQVSSGGKRETERFKTRQAANVWIRQELDKRDRGELVIGKTRIPMVGHFMLTWLNDSAKPKVRPMTLRGYEQLVRVHLIPRLGHIRLDKLTPAAIQAFQNQMIEAGKAPATVRYARAVLRMALRQAVRWGVIVRNPADLVDSPTVDRFKIRPLDVAEAQRFLAAVHGDRHEALYTVALTLGLRQGEALGLRWQDIDLDRGKVRVESQLQRVQGKLILVPCKTERSRRDLALSAFTLTALSAHRERQARELRALPGPASFVFTTGKGTPLEARNVVRSFKIALVKAGLPTSIRFHDLRHSAATLLIAQGVHARVVMEILGHSQIATTMNTYGHVLPETMRDAASRMEMLFSQAQ